jgi:hypothetical protein
LEGRPILVGGPPDLAAGRPRWRQGGPLTTYGRFDHLRDTGSYDGLSAKRGAAERASGPIATPR